MYTHLNLVISQAVKMHILFIVEKNQNKFTNEELFYDSDDDDKNQAWMDQLRSKYLKKSQKVKPGAPSGGQSSKPLPSSDAVLNCPGCMITLCLDCQR